MKIYFADVLLAEGMESAQQPFNLKIHAEHALQKVHALRASHSQSISRANVEHTLSFCVSKKHTSDEHARGDCLSHASTLEGLQGCVKFVNDQTGAQTLLLNATIKRIQSECKGLVSTHTYTFVGGKLLEK